MQKLTATAVKNAKTRTKSYNLSDGGGLYVLVKPNGTVDTTAATVQAAVPLKEKPVR